MTKKVSYKVLSVEVGHPTVKDLSINLDRSFGIKVYYFHQKPTDSNIVIDYYDAGLDIQKRIMFCEDVDEFIDSGGILKNFIKELGITLEIKLSDELVKWVVETLEEVKKMYGGNDNNG